jgi:NhaP-type Na+/H+ or K+/H+ antiporter
MATVILGIGILVFLAHFFTALFKRTRIPDVLLLMTLGVLIGPVFHLMSPQDFGKAGNVMSTLALIVILFESGIAMDPKSITKALRPSATIALPTFAATVGIVAAFSIYVLGTAPLVGWIAGAVLGGVSAAVVIPLVKSLGAGEVFANTMILESAMGDVLSIVLLLGLVQASQSGDLNPARMLGAVVSSLLMAAFIGVFGGIAWLLVLNKVRQLPDTAFTTLAVVFILYGVADEMGFSGAIAALTFGATLTNYEELPIRRFAMFRQRELGEIDEKDVAFFMEILFLLKTFFFVYLGASIQFGEARLAGMAALLCAAIYLARAVIVRLLMRHESFAWNHLSLAAVMVPKGLVSAVLAGIAVEAKVPGAESLREFVYMVILVSVSVTAICIPLMERRPFTGIFRWIFAGGVEPAPHADSEVEPV